MSQEFDLKTPDGCVKFWFFVWKFSPGTLVLYRRDRAGRNVMLWIHPMELHPRNNWVQARAPIKTNEPFKVIVLSSYILSKVNDGDYWQRFPLMQDFL